MIYTAERNGIKMRTEIDTNRSWDYTIEKKLLKMIDETVRQARFYEPPPLAITLIRFSYMHSAR